MDAGPLYGGRWIVADIGGTHSRFRQWSAERGLIEAVSANYRNDDFTDLVALVERYRCDRRSEATQAILALALPVGPGKLRMTNRDWSFTARDLRAALGLERLCLVNDFVAAAAGIGALGAAEEERIGGERAGSGPSIVIGPGTGLGAAGLLDTGGRQRVIASEAGHMGAAASGEGALAVHERLRAQHARVSWERMLCGAGLALFDAVARGAQTALEPAEVAARARAGEAAAQRAVSAFSHALGEFAGDLCLAFRATGGVHLLGGVLQGLGPAFDGEALRSGFEQKGRLGALLHAVPCYRVLVADVAERGLARILAREVEAAVTEA
jgi:glucokinase